MQEFSPAVEYWNGDGGTEEEESGGAGGAGMHLCVEEERMRSPSQSFQVRMGRLLIGLGRVYDGCVGGGDVFLPSRWPVHAHGVAEA